MALSEELQQYVKDLVASAPDPTPQQIAVIQRLCDEAGVFELEREQAEAQMSRRLKHRNSRGVTGGNRRNER